jgi:hypothetical protein
MSDLHLKVHVSQKKTPSFALLYLETARDHNYSVVETKVGDIINFVNYSVFVLEVSLQCNKRCLLTICLAVIMILV